MFPKNEKPTLTLNFIFSDQLRNYFEYMRYKSQTVSNIFAGNEILNPGDAVGKGLSVQAARSMNLCSGTAVGTSLIDGHCGELLSC